VFIGKSCKDQGAQGVRHRRGRGLPDAGTVIWFDAARVTMERAGPGTGSRGKMSHKNTGFWA
jgi:hypothetical protein